MRSPIKIQEDIQDVHKEAMNENSACEMPNKYVSQVNSETTSTDIHEQEDVQSEGLEISNKNENQKINHNSKILDRKKESVTLCICRHPRVLFILES